MTAFSEYEYHKELTLHISTPDDAEDFFSTNIDLHSTYDLGLTKHMYEYDIPTRVKKQIKAQNPDRDNFFIGIYRSYAKTEPVINSIRQRLQHALGWGGKGYNTAPANFKMGITFPDIDDVAILIEKKNPYYHLMGTRMTKKNMMMALSRTLYWSCFNNESVGLIEYLFRMINMPENISYVLENRCPYWFFDVETRQKMEVRLQVKMIGDNMCAIEISDNIWAPIALKELDIFVNYFHHGHNRTKKWRFLSPKKLWTVLMGSIPTESQHSLMTEFLCQNRTQDIVEDRALSLMMEMEKSSDGKIQLFNANGLFDNSNKPTVMVIKGQLTDWIIINNTYKTDIQKVKTYAYINDNWWKAKQRQSGSRRLAIQKGRLAGPICIDNIHVNSSVGDQYVARALALLNDITTVKMVSTISRYLPEEMQHEDCPDLIRDSRRLNWSKLENQSWDMIEGR